jgi:6-phospho-3-hexuloisomerase
MFKDQGTKAASILPMGRLYELAMLLLFETIVLEVLRRIEKTFGAARDRHTDLV